MDGRSGGRFGGRGDGVGRSAHPPVRPTAAILVALLTPLPTAAQNAPTVLARAEQAYHTLTSLRAEFEQILANPMLGRPETSGGTLFLVVPDRFAMRFSDPAGDRIVADGEWLWAYTPSTVPGQVIRQPVPQAGAATPNLFAQFVDRPLERYEASYAGRDTVAGDPVELVTLVPHDAALGFRRATIAVSERTGWIRRVAIMEASGQRRTLVLTTLTPNAAVPRAEVRFAVPRGVRIVSP